MIAPRVALNVVGASWRFWALLLALAVLGSGCQPDWEMQVSRGRPEYLCPIDGFREVEWRRW